MKNHRYRTLAAAVATATLLAGCYQDEFKPSPGFDGFLDLIGRECYPDTIGGVLVRQLAQGFGPGGGSGAGFIDATSSLYFRKWTTVQYRQFVTGMIGDNGAATNKAIDCIVSKLPAQQPGAAGGPPAGRDGVPPPPSR